MQQELGISNYGGGLNPKARIMLTEEEEYIEGLYATNDSGRDPRATCKNFRDLTVGARRVLVNH